MIAQIIINGFRLGIMLMTALTMIQIKVVEVIAAEADASAIIESVRPEWLTPSRTAQSEDYIFDFFTQEFQQITPQTEEIVEEQNETTYEVMYQVMSVKLWQVGILAFIAGLGLVTIIAIVWVRTA